jgi:serine/threonine-protein kinase
MDALPVGARIGRWHVTSVLGRGGMGVVYGAVADDGQRGAVKVIARELSSEAAFAKRFVREARAGQTIRHPNVAATIEAGDSDTLSFLVSELVEGGSLHDALKRRGGFPWREAAAIGAGIARGLTAIHEAGLIHRDLKPANVLLDGAGVPKIVDFGIAKRAAADGQSQALTKTGELLGTLEYMPPEQVDGRGAVDGRADLYALGATLHALVAGRPPFAGHGYELVKKHLADPPPPLGKLVPGVPPELERLVLALLEKAPADRPASAAEVAAALEAIAGGRAVERSRAPLVAAAVALVVLAGSAGVYGAMKGGRSSATVEPKPETPTPEPEPQRPVEPPKPPEPARAADLPLSRPPADVWQLRYAQETARSKLERVLGTYAWHGRWVAKGLGITPDGKHAITTGWDGVNHVWDLATGEEVEWWTQPDQGGNCAEVGGDLVIVGHDKQPFAKVWNHELRSFVGDLDGGHEKGVTCAAIAPGGETAVTGGDDAKVVVWDLRARSPRAVLSAHKRRISSVRFLPDARRFITTSWDGRAFLWRLGDTKPLGSFTQVGPIDALAISPDGALALMGTGDEQPGGRRLDGPIKLWDIETQRLVRTIEHHHQSVHWLVFTLDGKRAVSASHDGTLAVWDARRDGRGTPLCTMSTHDFPKVVACLPDGKRVLSLSNDHVLQLWDLETGRQLSGRAGEVDAIAVSADGKRAVYGTREGKVSVLDAVASTGLASMNVDQAVTAIALSRDSTRALVGTKDRRAEPQRAWVVLCDTAATSPAKTLGEHSTTVLAVAFDDGGRPMSLAADGTLRRWNADHPELSAPAEDVNEANGARAAAFAPGGPLVVGSKYGHLVIPGRARLTNTNLKTICASSGGRVAIGIQEGAPSTLQLFDLEINVARGEEFGGRKGAGSLRAAALSSDGRLAAAARAPIGSEPGLIELYDVETMTELERIALPARSVDEVTSLAFGRDDAIFAGTARGVVLRYRIRAPR